MLILRQLTVENFGPYKGQQVINFPERGVAIIYGENMRGKTSLLNAIRFALFGHVLARNTESASLHALSNWESAAEGQFGFKVVLEFDVDGVTYELTRSVLPKPSKEKPQADQDYERQVFLRRDGNVLSAGDRDLELLRIMPEQVSRFFLFDGELLQQYEDLLSNESDMGRSIKEAIERILGVPVLTGARADLRELQQAAQRQEAKAAQSDHKTREIGNLLAALGETRKHLQGELEKLRGEMDALRQKKSRLDAIIRKDDRARAMMREQEGLEQHLQTLESRQAQKADRRRDLMRDSWRIVLSGKVASIRQVVEGRIDDVKERMAQRAADNRLRENLRKALAKGVCTTCGRPVDEALRRSLQELATASDDTESTADDQVLGALFEKLAALKKCEVGAKRQLVSELTSDLDELAYDRRTTQDRIDEIGEQLKGFDQKAIRDAQVDYETTIKEMTITEEARTKTEAKLAATDDRIKSLEKGLDRQSGSELSKDRAKRELYEKLFDLFSEGVNSFRDELRQRVEKDATDLFLMLTSEPDYLALQINEGYGLTIVHRDGTPIRVRSAGAEHIVALSLIGALQRNAPLRGPIIMDSPFGRLDDAHTERVVRALPSMAEQVLLLVYEAELRPGRARNELLGNLKAEYRLVRQSAKFTTIERTIEV